MTALVVGGMVGGGIYVALGVVVETAGRWAWLSFVVAGVIAVTTAHSYGALSTHFETGGGVFGFLEKLDRTGMAGSLSWTMIVAYTLTLGLYAFAFGEYVSHAVGGSPAITRGLSLVALAALTGLNLLGVAQLKRVEVVIVSANVLVLVALGIIGLTGWDPSRLSAPDGARSIWAAGVGAAAIFVSYEGFQLLTYEYEEIEDPSTLTSVLTIGSAVVVLVYVLVAVGATMLIGAGDVLDSPTVSLAVAAERFAGTTGLVVMTVAAAFATSAAINSTLFSTAQLAGRVADDGELPAWLDARNDNDIPHRAVIVIAIGAGVLAVIGSLSGLVEAASLVFLIAFAAVNIVALVERVGKRWIAATALVVGAIVGVVLVYRLVTSRPVALGVVVAFMVASFVVRPWILRHVETE